LELNSPLHHSPLSPLPPFLEQFQQVSFFHFHIWVQNIFTIFTLLHPFLISSPIPLAPTPTCLFYFPLSSFLKKKTRRFCLFKTATQSVSLWHFQVHMY
jgi:hypothetical protein